MAAKAKVFQHLSGTVRTKHGLHRLKRGEEIPKDALPESVERLERLGAFDVPSEAEVAAPAEPEAPLDLAGASDEDLAKVVADATAKDLVSGVGEDVELAKRVLAAEQAGKDRKTAVEGLQKVIEPPAE